MQVIGSFRRKFRPGKRLLSNAGLFCLGGVLALNASATLAPAAADTHVNGALSNSARNQNYGNANNLQVSLAMTTLLRFDISTLPAGTVGLDVEKATLLLWVNNVATAGGMTLYALPSAWSESTVTFNTQPALGIQIATVPITAAMERQYISIDVTAQVRAWLDTPGSNYGLALRPTGAAPNTTVTFDSKENVGIPAMLDITLLSGGVAGPPGPAGPIGATGLIGPAGATGAIGATGATGPAGAPGVAGATGPIGATGAIGPVGATGPMGVTGATGTTGATGGTGATGATGPAGPQGLAGVAGAAGADGKTVLNGAADPLPTDGTDGDFYVNTSTNVLYGPKALGVWPPTGVSLAGPAGAQGPAGTNGTDGATGATGAQGPQGATGATGAAGLSGATGAQGLQGLTGATGAQGATGVQGPQGPQGATGPQGPIGLSGSYSVAVDINNNVVPFGFNQLIGGYTLTNSEGIVGRVASFTNTLFLKPGEQVNRQPIYITGLGTLYFTTAGCTGDIGYISGSSVIYSSSNGIVTLDAPSAVNTPINVSFWRYDMTTAPTLNLQPVSVRVGNGTCQNGGAALTSAIKMDRGASLSFLNVLWPVTP